MNLSVIFQKAENLSLNQLRSLFQIKHQQFNNIINPHEYSYILNPGNSICNTIENGDVTLLALVTSASYNFESRKVIRNTWANKVLFPQIKTVFVVGKSSNQTVNDLLNDEYRTYGDIVQEDYMDTYNNLTIKTVAAMKWGASFCKNAKFMLKIDDDLVVNTYSLITYLEGNFTQPLNNTMLCLINEHAKVIRDKTSKFYITSEMYEEEFYKPYCNGGAYFFSPDLAEKFYKTSLNTKQFIFEDVYVGMLANKLKTKFISLRDNFCWSEARCVYVLERQKIESNYIFFVNGMKPETMMNGWLEINDKLKDLQMNGPKKFRFL